MSYTSTLRPAGRSPWSLFFALILLLGIVCWFSFEHTQQNHPGRMEMKKSPGKNESHANQKARDRASEDYQKIKEELGKLDGKPNKSKEDVELRKKLRKKAEHWRKKKDWNGENHSQKHKGN